MAGAVWEVIACSTRKRFIRMEENSSVKHKAFVPLKSLIALFYADFFVVNFGDLSCGRAHFQVLKELVKCL